jgi:hypothetical protein
MELPVVTRRRRGCAIEIAINVPIDCVHDPIIKRLILFDVADRSEARTHLSGAQSAGFMLIS